MPYQELLTELENCADENYRAFHKKLLKNESVNVLGVRVPQLRKIAKEYKGRVDELIMYPDEFYEVTFVKLTAVSLLGYEEFIKYLDICVPLIDNWATCDCFVPKCIAKHREDFLPYIQKYAAEDKEFYQRFALTTLLHFYVEEDYAQLIFSFAEKSNTQYYYVHMAA
ncbi:MAG: DNA alkylation repair protein, partial [Clostridia bacterium]|nr:DNA alkylation repair protein [Clostridia bacterium]